MDHGASPRHAAPLIGDSLLSRFEIAPASDLERVPADVETLSVMRYDVYGAYLDVKEFVRATSEEAAAQWDGALAMAKALYQLAKL